MNKDRHTHPADTDRDRWLIEIALPIACLTIAIAQFVGRAVQVYL